MQQLIESALVNNRDLRVAALNVEAFQAQYRIQRADLGHVQATAAFFQLLAQVPINEGVQDHARSGGDLVQTSLKNGGCLHHSHPFDNGGSPHARGDAKRGKITVTDMRHPSGVRFSSTQSFVVSYVPAGTQNPVTVVLTPLPGIMA